MRPRRSIYEIAWDILTYCRTPRRMSQILLACNLNTKAANKYIEMLIRKGLLAEWENMYVTTERGLEYIRLFDELYKKIFED